MTLLYEYPHTYFLSELTASSYLPLIMNAPQPYLQICVALGHGSPIHLHHKINCVAASPSIYLPKAPKTYTKLQHARPQAYYAMYACFRTKFKSVRLGLNSLNKR